jgi:hypothetical protein
MVGDHLLRLAGSEFLSLGGRPSEVSGFLVVDHFPLPSASTWLAFLLFFPGATHVDWRAFQSDVLWYGRDYQRTEPSSPSLLEASLKVKRNNAHG